MTPSTLTKTNRIAATKAFLFLVLLSLITTAPLINNQFITGPLVNAMLYTSVILLGIRAAMLLSLLPSLIALAVGILSPTLMPMIPFIMVSNIVLVLVFSRLQKSFLFGVLIASSTKFVFLSVSTIIMTNFLSSEKLINTILTVFTWPQLITALAGGFLSYGLLKAIRKV